MKVLALFLLCTVAYSSATLPLLANKDNANTKLSDANNPLSSLLTPIGSLLQQVAKLQLPGAVDNLFIVVQKLANAIGALLDKISPGLGTSVQKLLFDLAQVLLCDVGSQGLLGDLIGPKNPGLSAIRQTQFCRGTNTKEFCRKVCRCYKPPTNGGSGNGGDDGNGNGNGNGDGNGNGNGNGNGDDCDDGDNGNNGNGNGGNGGYGGNDPDCDD